ncbi:MAG: methyltransferase domain-containing protein [Acidimicrobiales bacterium]
MADPADYLAERRDDVHAESPWSQFGYASRQLREVVRDFVDATGLEPGAGVLDYGCAASPYRTMLPPAVDYVGADLPGNEAADVVLRSDGAVPLPDRSFELVLSTQVLEHVEHPVLYLEECHRLLTTSGSLILSTHGIMYYHRDPEDYWRWTRVGLEKLLGECGFTVVEMRGVLAMAAAAIQIFQDATMWKVPRPLKPAYAAAMQGLIGFVDNRYEEPLRLENCLTIAVRAVKSGSVLTR